MNRERRKELNELQDRLQTTGLYDAKTNLENILEALVSVRDEEEAAFDAKPEALQTDDAIYPLTQINEAVSKLEELIEAIDTDILDEAFEAIEEAKGPAY